MQTEQKRKKLFNFRLPVALALALAAGIVYSMALAYFGLDGVFIALPVVGLAIAFIICMLVRKSATSTVYFLLAIIFFVLGAVYIYIVYFNYCEANIRLGQTCIVKGIVDKVGLTSGGRNYIVIKNAEAGGVKLNGKIIAYLSDKGGDYCENGYAVRFVTSLEKCAFFENGGVSHRALSGIKYYGSVYGGLDATWKFSPFGFVNSRIEQTLFNNLDGETAAVCFALLTGDTSMISEGTLASFRYGGIAHIFAVSGLHLAVLFGTLSAVLKRLPINKYVSAAVCFACLFFYSGVCSFTASSVRALVMCTLSVVASLTYSKNDSLNSLSVAAVILLLINPLYLFETGFTLSFSATIGIIILSRNLNDIFAFLPKIIRKPAVYGVSSLITITPTQIRKFGYVSVAGLFLNILIVPVISALYVLLFACVVIGMIIPFAAVILIPFIAMPLGMIINFTVSLGLENAVVRQSASFWIYIPFVVAVVGLSDKFNIKFKHRITLLTVAVALLTFGIIADINITPMSVKE